MPKGLTIHANTSPLEAQTIEANGIKNHRWDTRTALTLPNYALALPCLLHEIRERYSDVQAGHLRQSHFR
jgi:hypothetical protein